MWIHKENPPNSIFTSQPLCVTRLKTTVRLTLLAPNHLAVSKLARNLEARSPAQLCRPAGVGSSHTDAGC